MFGGLGRLTKEGIPKQAMVRRTQVSFAEYNSNGSMMFALYFAVLPMHCQVQNNSNLICEHPPQSAGPAATGSLVSAASRAPLLYGRCRDP